jgi:hypothetical protein
MIAELAVAAKIPFRTTDFTTSASGKRLDGNAQDFPTLSKPGRRIKEGRFHPARWEMDSRIAMPPLFAFASSMIPPRP